MIIEEYSYHPNPIAINKKKLIDDLFSGVLWKDDLIHNLGGPGVSGVKGVHLGAAKLPEHLGVETDPADVSLRFEIRRGHPGYLIAGEI